MSLEPRVPQYERVKASLIESIVDGRFAPGDQLPSLRDLCAHFGVSLATIQRAVGDLKEEEWLVAFARKGVMIADPLPPVAHLMRVKRRSQESADPPASDSQGLFGASGELALTCVIPDESLLPLFEWAAREHADACAPCSIRFKARSIRGRDDMESVRSLRADLALLPSYAVGRAAKAGAITPAEGMLDGGRAFLEGVPQGVVDLLTWQGKLWAAPVLVAAHILAADRALCGEAGIAPDRLDSVDALLSALEETADGASSGDIKLFNLALPLLILISAGHELPPLAEVPRMMELAEVQSLMRRLRSLARLPAVPFHRFDRCEAVDYDTVAVRHQPSGVFCGDAIGRRSLSALRIPDTQGFLPSRAYGMCVCSRSVHVFEAWEWAARLTGEAFQTRLAATAWDIPAKDTLAVQAAFGRAVGEENARVLGELIRRPSRVYGMAEEDVMAYLWEVLGNELYRFLAGENSYSRMIERTKTKTERFLRRSEGEPSLEPQAGPIPA